MRWAISGALTSPASRPIMFGTTSRGPRASKEAKISQSMRSVCANSFDVVEGIRNGSKHSGNTYDDFLFAPGAEQVIPPTGYGVGGYSVGGYGGAPGLVVQHKGHRMLVDFGLCAVLSGYGQLYPAHFASIDFQEYRKRVPGGY